MMSKFKYLYSLTSSDIIMYDKRIIIKAARINNSLQIVCWCEYFLSIGISKETLELNATKKK